MPELPDITLYVEALAGRVEGATLESIRVHGPSLLRSVDPPLAAAERRRVAEVRRLGKRGVLETSLDGFRARLAATHHTLKRALTDPRVFSGIGNACSDEILHRSRLSPVKLAGKLTDAEHVRLFTAAQTTLKGWTERLRAEAGGRFPEHVSAFRDGVAVHERYHEPCPDCGAPVQRIVFAAHETNYCAPCQTQDRLLTDRALSRLLKKDWPRTLEELEERRGARPEADA